MSEPEPAAAPNLVEARLYKGLKDYLPEEAAARQRIIDVVRGVFEGYGFSPLGTPAIEYLDVLRGSGAGEETSKQLFHVKGPEPEPIALRFDLTVPLARVVSQYQDLPRPFRRYQVAQVWRADKPDPGRFREFTQFDIDSVGVASDVADVEIVAAICDALAALEVGAFQVRFSSRRILNLLLRHAEVPDPLRVAVKDEQGERVEERPASDVFRVLDKLEKAGLDNVRAELMGGYTDRSGAKIPGLGLEPSQVARIEAFLGIRPGREATLQGLRALFAALPGAGEEIDVLDRMSARLAALGYGEDRVVIDLSIARGLGYYTGPVWETVLQDLPRFGSVCSGGRYDFLVQRFLGESVPATGTSIGVDRLLAALVELKRIRLRRSVAQVLVTAMDPALVDDYLAMAFELRRAGIKTELYLGTGRFGKQVKHADHQQIPLAVICGGDEKARGTVILKEMDQGRQRAASTADRGSWLSARPGQLEVPRADLVLAAKRLLADPVTPA